MPVVTVGQRVGKGELLGVPMPIVIYLVLIVLCIWLLHRTKYGERLYLIGVNQQAAEYSGINTRLVILSTYVLSAVSAALAGTILTSNVNSAKYNVGSGYTLAIITAVVLGGTLNTGGKGSILGTVLASLIICILRYGLPLCFDVGTQNLDLPIGIGQVHLTILADLGEAGNRLLADFTFAINDPEVKKRMVEQGLEIVASTPAEFTAFQAREWVRWKTLIETRKITAD